jgi:hypothetical protein
MIAYIDQLQINHQEKNIYSKLFTSNLFIKLVNSYFIFASNDVKSIPALLKLRLIIQHL